MRIEPATRASRRSAARIIERDDRSEEGWSIRASVEEMLREFAGWYDDVQAFIRATPPDLVFK